MAEKGVFDKTLFVDTPEHVTISRLENRLVNEIGFSEEEAEERVQSNDLINAYYIKDNTDLNKHDRVVILTKEEKQKHEEDWVSEFLYIM